MTTRELLNVLLVILCGWFAIAGGYAAYRLILMALGRRDQ